MGDRARRLTRQLLHTAFEAALPALIIYAILLCSLMLRGTLFEDRLSPKDHLIILIVCYITALVNACILRRRSLHQAVLRIDERLIGSAFGGWRRQDRLFCSGMENYQSDHFRAALEQFLAVREYPLEKEETGVLAFYIGRCYQELGAPSNAVTQYQTARENGFSKHYAMLFQARSHAEGGDFSQSLAVFTEMLETAPMDEFYFLYTDIGFLYIRQKQPEQAAEWFQRSIEQHMNYAFALSGLAIAALQQGDFRKAADYRCQALMNRLAHPDSFKRYYDDTKSLMLEEHPEWAQQETAAQDSAQQNTSAL